MAVRRIKLLALLASAATAFRNTSPFFLFSTTHILDDILDRPNLASSSSVNDIVFKIITDCSSDAYFVVQQPGVSPADFAEPGSTPYLRQWLNSTDSGSRSSWIVPGVVGELDADAIAKEIQDRCKASLVTVDVSSGSIPNENVSPRIVRATFNPLPDDWSARVGQLRDHDSFIHAVISTLGGEKYTILYTTTPPSNPHVPKPPVYEMDNKYDTAYHEDLKRDLTARANDTLNSDLPLFERYQYLSPGIFMGLFVSIILFLIFYVGITALSSLQVSYFAFSKDFASSAQKKQQ